MKKLFLFSFFSIFALCILSALTFFHPPSAQATICQLKLQVKNSQGNFVDATPFSSTFNNFVQIIEKTSQDCLANGNYYAILYPQSSNTSALNANTVDVFHPSFVNGHTLSDHWDFTAQSCPGDAQGFHTCQLSPNGSLSDGQYALAVCAGNTVDLQQCVTGSANINTLSLTVTSTVDQNNPLPIIDPKQQQACTIQFGTDFKITVSNLKPPTNYSFWWKDEDPPIGNLANTNAWGSFNAGKSTEQRTITKDKNQQTSSARELCVDGFGQHREDGANCIMLNITALAPAPGTNTSCSSANTTVPNAPTCNPSCPIGQTCVTAESIASGVNFGPFGSLIQNLGNLPTLCIPNTPTPTQCTQPLDCAPYACINGLCDTTKFENGTPVPTANPLCPNNQCQTAIGTIPTDPAGFVSRLVSIILGLSGGIATILIIIAGYTILSSQGNPEKIQGAKESLTSAIVGLLFIIFAFVILQVITVDILKIPGFGK